MMLNGLLEFDQRKIQRKKRQLYKQILDHQIFINKKYKQQRTQNSQTYRRTNNRFDFTEPIKVNNSNPRNKQRYTIEQNRNNHILPTITDKHTHYKGSSHYYPIDRPQIKNYATNDPKNRIGSNSSSDDSINGIIEELQTINDQSSPQKLIKQTKPIKPISLSNNKRKYNAKKDYSPSFLSLNSKANVNPKQSGINRKNRMKTIDRQSNIPSKIDFGATFRQSEPFIKQIKNHSKMTEHLLLNQEIDSSSPDKLFDASPNKEVNNLRSSFLNILKKVNNRGENLLQRLKQYPNSSLNQYRDQ